MVIPIRFGTKSERDRTLCPAWPYSSGFAVFSSEPQADVRTSREDEPRCAHVIVANYALPCAVNRSRVSPPKPSQRLPKRHAF
jgi:hypothetical protein